MIIQNVINKPPLFHYTKPEALLSVLDSRSLWASPTWNFPDKREYVLGLELIARRLKDIYSRRLEMQEFPHSLLSLLAEYRVNPRRLLELTIAHVDYEWANYDNPKVQVYVACVTENGKSEDMAAAYGNCVIKFNWLLPVLAYAFPSPFTFSMLSFVTYDPLRFEQWIMTMGFDISQHLSEFHVREFLDPLDVQEREVSLALTVAILLCSFATNIKEPKYQIEQEWRMKTIRSLHSTPTPFTQDYSRWRTDFFGLSDRAAPFAADPPGRYIQELSIRGRFIVEDVAIYLAPPVSKDAAEKAQALLAQVDALRRTGAFAGPMTELRDLFLKGARDGVRSLALPGIL
jgi:hypothetical protein